MVQLVNPIPDDTTSDPACGTTEFLVLASEYIRNKFEGTMAIEQGKR